MALFPTEAFDTVTVAVQGFSGIEGVDFRVWGLGAAATLSVLMHQISILGLNMERVKVT